MYRYIISHPPSPVFLTPTTMHDGQLSSQLAATLWELCALANFTNLTTLGQQPNFASLGWPDSKLFAATSQLCHGGKSATVALPMLSKL